MKKFYDYVPIRASAVLTNSYVAATVLSGEQYYNQLVLEFAFTLGSLTSIQFKIEGSEDGVTFYQETNGEVATTADTMYALEHTLPSGSTGSYFFATPIMHKYIKISVKGTGTVTNSLLAVKAALGEV